MYEYDTIISRCKQSARMVLSTTRVICITSRLRSTNNTNKPFPQGGVFLYSKLSESYKHSIYVNSQKILKTLTTLIYQKIY